LAAINLALPDGARYSGGGWIASAGEGARRGRHRL